MQRCIHMQRVLCLRVLRFSDRLPCLAVHMGDLSIVHRQWENHTTYHSLTTTRRNINNISIIYSLRVVRTWSIDSLRLFSLVGCTPSWYTIHTCNPTRSNRNGESIKLWTIEQEEETGGCVKSGNRRMGPLVQSTGPPERRVATSQFLQQPAVQKRNIIKRSEKHPILHSYKCCSVSALSP